MCRDAKETVAALVNELKGWFFAFFYAKVLEMVDLRWVLFFVCRDEDLNLPDKGLTKTSWIELSDASLLLSSSAVEQVTVNHLVVGSNPTPLAHRGHRT